jgi:RsiW-degrading membrane proteinase PrsW (M82 family)
MPILASLFFGFVPMFLFALFVYWLDRYEKEPKPLLTSVFFWGVFIAAGGAFIINTLFGAGIFLMTESQLATEITTGSLIAPVVEESLKGLAVVIVFLLFRREFDSILDGIIYAAIVALGFAATENSWYIYNGYTEAGWSGFWLLVFVRVVLVGWQHPFYTAFIGIGLAVARLNRRALPWLLAPLVGWCLAVLAHSFHNSVPVVLRGGPGFLLGTALDWSGWAAMTGFVIWALWRESVCLKKQLKEEVELGLLTPEQYRTAGSVFARFGAGAAALFNGRYPATVRFYQTCGELAHKKQQFATLGDEGTNQLIIQQLRAHLAALSPQAQA